ncbi:MAG: hypothetical protein OEV85_10400 [Candidatus Thorarchaeota archaeon]|nr:hypothetical protein [Candidatus Thorarchaeota archaeon]
MQYELYVNTIGALGFIIVLLIILLSLWGAFSGSGRSRNLSLLQFFGFIFLLVSVVVVMLARMGIISTVGPLSDWTLWGQYLNFGMRYLFLFFIAIYVVMWAYPDFFSVRKWAYIVFLIGPIVVEIFMFLAFGNGAYTQLWLISWIVLAILYMVLIPLYASVKYTRQDRIRGTPRVKWIWLTLVGLLSWFFGEMIVSFGQLLSLGVTLTNSIALTIVSFHTFGWFLILVGSIFQGRSIRASA